MSASSLYCVVTTIQPPTACARRLDQSLAAVGARMIVMGDRKGPSEFSLPTADMFMLAQQEKLPFQLAPILPVGHYVRKNLGYLVAIERGAGCLYETDDDNMPNAVWKPRDIRTQAQPVAARKWMNVYRLFTDELIWPRGFPLDAIRDPQTWAHDPATPSKEVVAPIQQGLADLAPDVDAVWRLILDREFYFKPGPSVLLPPGTWCPFNSQTTWWWPQVYPLLYLPAYCSFRMTDIWRSFVAQRCLWELGHGLVFHAAEATQERNVHNLQRDFNDEVPGYQRNRELIAVLEGVKLDAGPDAVGENLLRCYLALSEKKFFHGDEVALVKAWLADLKRLTGR